MPSRRIGWRMRTCLWGRVGRGRRAQRLGKNARRARLPRPARADEKIRLRQPVLPDGVLQRADNVLLPDDFIEGLRTIFAGENRVAHGRTLDASRRIEKRRA